MAMPENPVSREREGGGRETGGEEEGEKEEGERGQADTCFPPGGGLQVVGEVPGGRRAVYWSVSAQGIPCAWDSRGLVGRVYASPDGLRRRAKM